MAVFEEIAERVRPYADRAILCRETAADFQGLSNGSVFLVDPVQVYMEESLEIPGLEVICCAGCFQAKKYFVEDGVCCTTPEQTILDMLEDAEDVNIQSLLESMANYYFCHEESFGELLPWMTDQQRKAFDRWKHDAVNYYTED